MCAIESPFIVLCHADELEATLRDLQFLAAAGEADAEQHNGVLALIRSYLCLLKAEQQVHIFIIRFPSSNAGAHCRRPFQQAVCQTSPTL